jgi:hypothetical protein
MSFSISLPSAPGNPRCLLRSEEGKRLARQSLSAARQFTTIALRVAITLLMIGLALALPRILPLFAMTVPFWIALELEAKLARAKSDGWVAVRSAPRRG